jgi:hypothetical protein
MTTSRRESELSRRRFLQAAVLGSAGVAGLTALDGLVAPIAMAAPTAPTDSAIPAEWVMEGRLLDVGDGTVDVLVDDMESRFTFSDSTEFWRGSEGMSPTALASGDSLLMRMSSQGPIQYAWANLTRLTGQVLSASAGTITVDDDQGGTVAVSTDQLPSGPDGVAAVRGATPGDLIDLIGLWDARTGLVLPTLAQTLSLAEGGSAEQLSQPLDTEGVPDNTGGCHYTYYGSFTWFTCPTGAGACATCSTARSDQIAWPSIGTGCHFSTTCAPQIVLSCGSLVNIQDVCTGLAANLYIADCGPNKNKYCSNHCTSCGLTYTHPTVDLTKPTFARFANPALLFCFPGRAIATVEC